MSRDAEAAVAQPKRRTLNNSFWVKGGYFDYQILFIMITLVLFGIMMVYSSSSYRAVMSGESNTYFAKRQAAFAVLGLITMLVVSHVNYRYYKKFTMILMYIAIVLSGLVFVIGTASHGATRWLPLGPIHFQPSEVAKPIIIIYMAHICVSQSALLNSIGGVIKMVLLPVICVGLIAKENLSTAVVCFAIIVIILFVASPKLKNIIILGIAGVAAALVAIFAVGYRGDRIDAWLHPETSVDGFQTMQSLYAIGSGGLFGRGLVESIQKMGFLPESHNDMIFSVICEELGLFGAIAVIILFVMLLVRFRYVANNSPDSFGGLICTGVITHIAVQFIINIGVVTNTIPPTGVTLPFISYGGTSLVFLLVEVGMVLGVSRQMRPMEDTL